MKTTRNRKLKLSRLLSERWTLCFSSYKNRELKVKLRWAGAHEKKTPFFITFVVYLNVYSIEWTFRIYTLTYQKTFIAYPKFINFFASLHKKWSFPLRSSSVNVTKSEGNCEFGHISEEILNENLHFLCSACFLTVENLQLIHKASTL